MADNSCAQSTRIMAVLNITPDSFSDGGQFLNADHTVNLTAVVGRAMALVADGAAILDVGGESTRPGAMAVPVEEELRRVVPVIRALKQALSHVPISIDTRKAAVAQQAVEAGASIINDVSGLQFDPHLVTVAAQTEATLIIMHSQGTPDTMQDDPTYNDVVLTVKTFFEGQIQTALAAGVKQQNIWLDPGFGFGKTVFHNLQLLKHLSVFQALGCPILVGLSRKSFLTLGDTTLSADHRESLTAAALALAVQNGASIVRAHEPKIHRPVVCLVDTLMAQ